MHVQHAAFLKRREHFQVRSEGHKQLIEACVPVVKVFRDTQVLYSVNNVQNLDRLGYRR
jgi:hypothetical protein